MARALVTIVANKGGDSGEHNVKAYGATGDGTTNDRTALNTANTAAANGDLYFPNGTYKISSNLTLSASCVFAKGAMLSIDNGIVVTITGNIYAPATQIFTGSGTVSFLGNYLETEVTPQWWGVVGNGSTNNTTALNACFTAANTGGIPVVFPKGTYYFDDTITIPTAIKMVDMSRASMVYTAGATTYKSAIVVGDSTVASRPTYNSYIGLNVDRLTLSNWTDEADIGIQIYNANNCEFTDIKVYDFCIGLQCISKPSASNDRGFGYNTIGLNILNACKVGVDLTNAANNGSHYGWTNQNRFDGGRFAGSSSASHNTLARYGIRLLANASSTYDNFSNNTFYSPCFELGASGTTGEAVGILINDSHTQNKVYGARDENNDYVMKCADSASFNTAEVCYGDGALSDTSSYTGSNVVKLTKKDYIEGRISIFESGNLADKAMYTGNAVTLPAPVFYGVYSTLTRAYSSTNFSLSSSGLVYSAGTLIGAGIRINTSVHKKFSVSHNGIAMRYYFVCYDANGVHLDADAATYCWSLNPARSLSKSTYFVSSGKSYYSGADATYFDVGVHDDVKFVDIILGIDTGTTVQSFSVYALDATYTPQVVDVYEPAGGWGQCQGTAIPNKYWKSYNVNRKLYQAVTATGGYTGWVCTNQKDTTLTAGEPLGETVMVVGASATMLATDVAGVLLDDGTIHWTTIASVDSGTQITLTNALPSASAAGKAVYTNRWLGYGTIA